MGKKFSIANPIASDPIDYLLGNNTPSQPKESRKEESGAGAGDASKCNTGAPRKDTKDRKNITINFRFSENELEQVGASGITKNELPKILRLKLREMGVKIPL